MSYSPDWVDGPLNSFRALLLKKKGQINRGKQQKHKIVERDINKQMKVMVSATFIFPWVTLNTKIMYWTNEWVTTWRFLLIFWFSLNFSVMSLEDPMQDRGSSGLLSHLQDHNSSSWAEVSGGKLTKELLRLRSKFSLISTRLKYHHKTT